MRQEYRIIFTMTFDNDSERDDAYAKIKTAITNQKASINYRQAHMTKDDYPVPEPSTEAI
jgi:hypothetical protein